MRAVAAQVQFNGAIGRHADQPSRRGIGTRGEPAFGDRAGTRHPVTEQLVEGDRGRKRAEGSGPLRVVESSHPARSARRGGRCRPRDPKPLGWRVKGLRTIRSRPAMPDGGRVVGDFDRFAAQRGQVAKLRGGDDKNHRVNTGAEQSPKRRCPTRQRRGIVDNYHRHPLNGAGLGGGGGGGGGGVGGRRQLRGGPLIDERGWTARHRAVIALTVGQPTHPLPITRPLVAGDDHELQVGRAMGNRQLGHQAAGQ